MDKQEAITKLIELKRLQRELEDLAESLDIGDISEDKIYIAIKTYRAVLTGIANRKGD